MLPLIHGLQTELNIRTALTYSIIFFFCLIYSQTSDAKKAMLYKVLQHYSQVYVLLVLCLNAGAGGGRFYGGLDE